MINRCAPLNTFFDKIIIPQWIEFKFVGYTASQSLKGLSSSFQDTFLMIPKCLSIALVSPVMSDLKSEAELQMYVLK